MRRRNRRLNQTAVGALGVLPTDHVLEIGYGSGDALALVAKMARGGFAAGIDRSMDMLQRGWNTVKRSKSDSATVLRGDVSWLPWSACSFDKVLCVDGITEWASTRSGLEEIFRVLRPGGVFVLAEHITQKLTKMKAMSLAHLLTVVGFTELEVQLEMHRDSETLLVRATRP